MSSSRAYATLTTHRHYAYRGCAPDPDQPTHAQGDLDVSINAWLPYTDDDGEAPAARNARQRTAVAVCDACPVLNLCRAYALSETPDGKLAEPEGVWGGMLPLERHRDLVARRTAQAPETVAADDRRLDECRTAQKQAVLRSLASNLDEELVAYRAGMDVRTANWHRSLLCGLLGLDKESATRQQLLDAARRLGVLPEGIRIAPDGRWPIAAAPNTDGSRQRRLAPAMPVQLILPGYQHLPRTRRTASAARTAVRRLRLVRTVEHLTLDTLLPVTLETAA